MKRLALLLMALFLLTVLPATAQNFGMNKVNYTPFNWHTIPTAHFDIYYTDGGYETALIASSIAEDSFRKISQHWNHVPIKRIPLLIYNSHNDFTQTNVITEIITEGTGGFTELFKNRMVVPWEGSLGKLRHVINHELTHAMMFDMIYGGLLDSVVGREYLFQVPLWFAEGLAEHESRYWDTEADMIVRDGIISGYLPPIQQIYGGYLAYKGGESFFRFIQEEYGAGRWVAGELLTTIKTTKDVDKAYRAVVGKGLEDLSKEWHKKLRAEHWPDVKDREISEDFATKLTDHVKTENYLNVNPAFNPTGDKIAFLTDRNEYKEILVMSALDGRILSTVIKGEKAGDYEEIHWLRGGITWSPDGSMVAFAGKAAERDAIHIKKVEEAGFNKVIKLDMDALFSPNWSPDGKRILFCGIREGKLDIFVVEIATGEYTRLTNDFFDEYEPAWSPDGKTIAFASDRDLPPYEYRLDAITDDYDIFLMNADGTNIRRLTDDPHNDRSPDWAPDGTSIVYTSDRNGITNLYSISLDSHESVPITNVLNGVTTPNWSPDGTKIAFSEFNEGGWDISILKRPLKRDLTQEKVYLTQYRLQEIAEDSTRIASPDTSDVILSDTGAGQTLSLQTIDQRPYKIKFSPDLFNAFASYNTFMGFGGEGEISVSDVMGNHRIEAAGNLYYSIEESNIFVSYYYLKRRINYGVGVFHYKNYYRSTNWDIFSDRSYGISLLASRPFNRFNRLDTTLSLLQIERDTYTASYYYDYYNNYDYGVPYFNYKKTHLDGLRSLTIGTELINDTTLWGYTGPVNGQRYRLSIEHSPSIISDSIEFTTIEGDYRRYFRTGGKYTITGRISGGASTGENPRLFFLGGTDNWLNARIASVPGYIEARDDLFFSRFPSPLRGYRYYERYGSKYFLTNWEFRFPFIDYLAFGWPIPLAIGNITGILFGDLGAAWDHLIILSDGKTVVRDSSFHGAGRTDSDSFYLDDIALSWGIGMRIDLGFAVVRLDTAWKPISALEPGTSTISRDRKPTFYLSIGPDF